MSPTITLFMGNTAVPANVRAQVEVCPVCFWLPRRPRGNNLTTRLTLAL